MTQPFKIACVQNRAVDNTETSVGECLELIQSASDQGAELICTPEFCGHLHVDGKTFQTGARPEHQHEGLRLFQQGAAQMQRWLLVGSLAVVDEAGQLRNRSFVIDPNGKIVSRYDKIHMFDVNLKDGEVYRESDTFTPGSKLVIAQTPYARLGLSVCYDLRFAALYRLLAQNGATVLTVPAAFTHTTGKAHWHVLLRSRAIETGSFVVAPCQYGYHGNARTYGHSLIIGPWGQILAEGGDDQDMIIATIDPAEAETARAWIPALEHDRPLSFG